MRSPAAGYSLGDKELQEARIERRFVGIAGDPGTILRDGSVFRQTLRLNHGKDTLKRLPRLLLGRGRKFLDCDGCGLCHERERLDFVGGAKATVIEVR